MWLVLVIFGLFYLLGGLAGLLEALVLSALIALGWGLIVREQGRADRPAATSPRPRGKRPWWAGSR